MYVYIYNALLRCNRRLPLPPAAVAAAPGAWHFFDLSLNPIIIRVRVRVNTPAHNALLRCTSGYPYHPAPILPPAPGAFVDPSLSRLLL